MAHAAGLLAVAAAAAHPRSTVPALHLRAFAALAHRTAAAPTGALNAAAANPLKPAGVWVAAAPLGSHALPLFARETAGADAAPTAYGTRAAASKAKALGAKFMTAKAHADDVAAEDRAVAKAKARKDKEIAKKAKAKAKAAKARETAKKAEAVSKARALLGLKRSFPKRDSNPLTLFKRENFESGITVPEGIRAVTDKWKNLPQSTKQSYEMRARANSENYLSEVERWRESLTPELKALLSGFAFRKTLHRYQALALHRTGHPPAKLSAYASFRKEVFAEVSAEIKRAQPSLAGKPLFNAVTKQIGSMWRCLSDEQKTAYSSG